MKLFLLFIMFTQNSFAIDYQKYIKKMKVEMNNLLGKNNNEVEELPFVMPEIPRVQETSTSTNVYNKKGIIYTQGAAFNNLSQDEKRRFRVAFIKELYSVTRGAEANNSELSQGVNILEQGGSREGVYRSLVLSSEYKSLELYEESPSDKLVSFTVNYGVKFLGLQYDKQQIAKLNLWGIKRIITEKTLEIIDSFNSDGEDLYKWYAYLSFELSKKYTSVWKNKIRNVQKLEYHYNWAKKVPFQQIKSEVIIKLHRVMNSL